MLCTALLTSCMSNPEKRVINKASRTYDASVLPKKNAIVITFEDIDIEGENLGWWWTSAYFLGPLSAPLLVGKKWFSNNSIESTTESILASEFKKVGISSGDDGDYYLEVKFEPSDRDENSFISTFSLKNKFDQYVYDKVFYVSSSSSDKNTKEDKNKKFIATIARAAKMFAHDIDAHKAMAIDAVKSDTRLASTNTQKKYRPNKSTSIGKFSFTKLKKTNYNSYALVIGINDYQSSTNVNYADNSALAFSELANKSLGIPKENIITLLNEKATSGQIKTNLEIIKELPEKNGIIYLFFAGHGVPGKHGSSYILPSDMSADAIHLEPQLKLEQIYKRLSTSQASRVFVFMDTCFSGKDDQGNLLYKGVAPVLRTQKTKINSNKLTIFTAGKSSDFANDLEDQQHRLFSYHLINELSKGKKNLNTVYENIRRNVKRSSLMKGIGYKQVPQLYGKSNQKLY
jgi:hypothetical protein